MPTIVCQACGHHNPHNTPVERFWNQIDKDGPTPDPSKKCDGPCWEWRSGKITRGYGQASRMVDGKLKQTNASRLAWIYTNGEINDSTVCVCHKCDNPLCCNPDHLFLGTNAVNTADKVAKGRQPKGEEMPAAKLTEDNVRAIKAEYRPGKDGISYRDLSWKYDVSQETIRDIIKGRLWKHVQ